MTCKDCIHEKVCEGSINTSSSVEKNCKFFKNKTDVVEVVRCKDCIYFKESEVTNSCYCDWHREYFETYPNDYCSYGTPKERGEEK